jgi:hypothetical protein
LLTGRKRPLHHTGCLATLGLRIVPGSHVVVVANRTYRGFEVQVSPLLSLALAPGALARTSWRLRMDAKALERDRNRIRNAVRK